MSKVILENISIDGPGKVIGRDDNSVNNYFEKQGKIAALFKRLKIAFDEDDRIEQISEDLKRYINSVDTLGLERKIEDANLGYELETFLFLKQEFHKKLVRFQNYEPAQELFAYILAIVLEKYRNRIRPEIQKGVAGYDLLPIISQQVYAPIAEIIESEGASDIINISLTEIEGMYHYLTGNCHIKWTK